MTEEEGSSFIKEAVNEVLYDCIENGVPDTTEEIQSLLGPLYPVFCESLFIISDEELKSAPPERVEMIKQLKELVKQ